MSCKKLWPKSMLNWRLSVWMTLVSSLSISMWIRFHHGEANARVKLSYMYYFCSANSIPHQHCAQPYPTSMWANIMINLIHKVFPHKEYWENKLKNGHVKQTLIVGFEIVVGEVEMGCFMCHGGNVYKIQASEKKTRKHQWSCPKINMSMSLHFYHHPLLPYGRWIFIPIL